MTANPNRVKPELLAPAGNLEAFHAALAAGADAIYLGTEAFNARRGADNFTAEELKQACHEAHLRRRKVYFTINTLIFPGEMDEALHTVSQAVEAGVDAAIVQDVGLMSAIRRDFPELEIHASTQMNIRDAKGIEIARKLGATRVTLARELPLKQIAKLAEEGMPLEVFVHGALCICQSGQCLLSSLIGGRSANRGLCAQPCRLPYRYLNGDGKQAANPGDYLLSPRDLMGIELLPQLIDAGVASLKIEGRMKSPEYVSTVTAIYRAALDRAFENPDTYSVSEDEINALGEAFTRGFTTAYLEGERGNDIMGYRRPNNRGLLVGRVTGFRNDMVLVKTNAQLEVGDLLEIWTGQGSVTHQVTGGDDIRKNNVELDIRRPVAPGDRIFRVRSAALANDVKQRTEDGLKIHVSIHVTMCKGSPLVVEVSDGMVSASAQGPVVEAARTKAVSREDVIEHVGRLGSTPYVCDFWSIDLDEGVGIGFSQLHKVRAAAVKAYEAAVLEQVASEPRLEPAPLLDFRGVVDMSDMAIFITEIDFNKTDIALDLGSFTEGCQIGPKLYATNIYALQTWAALGATFCWVSPELTLHQIKLLADDSPIPLGIVVHGAQELMVSDHCFLTVEGPCDHKCSKCKRRKEVRYYADRKGYRFPVRTDTTGRGHLYNAVPLDIIHAIPDLKRAGVVGYAIDKTLMEGKQVPKQIERCHQAFNGKTVRKEENSTTGHLFRQVR